MSGLKGMTNTTGKGNDTPVFEEPSHFRRRSILRKRWWSIPRRYIMAMMCYLAFFIIGWMLTDIWAICAHIILMEEEERLIHFPKTVSWTVEQLELMESSYEWGALAAQIPAAIFATLFTGHRLLVISVGATSILHMLMLLTLQDHAAGIIAIIFLHGFAASPMRIACLTLLREWAPPGERTRIVIMAVSGFFISFYVAFELSSFMLDAAGPTVTYISSGASGVIWCLLWCTLTSDSPTNDSFIADAELLYLEDKIPAEYKEKIPLKEIPFVSIFTSLPVISLCLVFFSFSFALKTVVFGLLVYYIELEIADRKANWMFAVCITILAILPLTGYLVDFILIKTNGRTTLIRKIFCSGGLAVHAIFLLAAYVPNIDTSIALFIISYIFLILSISGHMPNALDLTPRYVAIVMTIANTCFILGSYSCEKIIDQLIDGPLEDAPKKMFLISGVLSGTVAIFFLLFGSGEEQSWSSVVPSSRRNQNDALCYPASDTVDEDSLVTPL